MSILNQHVNYDMPAEKYHAVDALSKSMMTKLLKSPAHYKAALEERQEPTKAMQIGTAVHAAVLEPHLYQQLVAVIPPDVDPRTKEGKAWKEQYKSRSIVLTTPEDLEIQGIANSVRRHPFWDIIHLDHKIEASIFAEDEETGLPLKARPDMWVEDHTLVDIKTTDDASPDAFVRTITNFGYHIQAAHYLAMTGAENFIFVAVERKAPYAVGIYRLDAEWVQMGEAQRRKAITILHECKAMDNWPAYPTSTVTLSCPRWALNKSDQ